MGAVSGQATTFNLPQYAGELFLVSPSATPLLSLLGSGVATDKKVFSWQTVDLGSRVTTGRLEGAAAPTAGERSKSEVYNVCEIFQKQIELTYTAQAAINSLSNTYGGGVNGAPNELDLQTMLALKDMALDVNYQFINGTKTIPVNNSSARLMGGLLEAISTNEVTASGDLTAYDVNDAMQDIFDANGFEQGNMVMVVPSVQKMWLSKVYITASRLETSRNVGGVSVSQIVTDFGNLDIIIDNAMPTDTIMIINKAQVKPRILNIPGKGFLFVEPLAKTGSSDCYQLYGEIGIQWGNQLAHAKITGLTATNPA